MAGGSIFNTWQFAFQYGGLKTTHNKNKTQLKTVIILGCLRETRTGEATECPRPCRRAQEPGGGSLAGRDSLQGEGRCPAFSPGHICGPFPVPCAAAPQPQTRGKRGPSAGRAHPEWGVSGAGDGGTGSRAWRHNPGTKGGHGDGPAGASQGHLPKEAVP